MLINLYQKITKLALLTFPVSVGTRRNFVRDSSTQGKRKLKITGLECTDINSSRKNKLRIGKNVRNKWLCLNWKYYQGILVEGASESGYPNLRPRSEAKNYQTHFFVFGARAPQWAMASSFTRFLYHTQRRTTVGRTPLDEWSARRRDFCLTTHNTHNTQTSMNPGGIRTHNLSRPAAADLRLRPRGQWDWPQIHSNSNYYRTKILFRLCGPVHFRSLK